MIALPPLPATGTLADLPATACRPRLLSAWVAYYAARRPQLSKAVALRRACRLLSWGLLTDRGWLGRYAAGLTYNAAVICGNVGAGLRARA